MLTKIKLKDTLFALENKEYINKILKNRIDGTNYSTLKSGSDWVVYVLNGDEYAYITHGYGTKKEALAAIVNGTLKKWLQEQAQLYGEITGLL